MVAEFSSIVLYWLVLRAHGTRSVKLKLPPSIQFVDKTTLGSSAILGIKTTAHLDANQYVVPCMCPVARMLTTPEL